MLTILRTNSENQDFVNLVQKLDMCLAEMDGADNKYYAQFNKIQMIRHSIVAYEQDEPLGIGAIKTFDPITVEVKRMYTLPDHRSKGIASTILRELEKWAQEMAYSRCVLETGRRQQEAVKLYSKMGYHLIDNYGQYVGMENSLCFEKIL